jgi:DNA-binding CsgD family transcriptional regulator
VECSLDQQDDLIVSLYEVAKDTSMLPSFISAIGKVFRAHVTGMRIYDAANAERNHFASIGLSPVEWAKFDAESRWCDVWRATAVPDLMENGISHSGSFFPWREFSKTAWYNDYAKRIDVAHGMGLRLSARRSDNLATISLNRSHRIGEYQPEELAFAQRLLPHLRSAYAIMRRFSLLEAKAATFSSAVDRLQIGFIIVDSAGECLYRNDAADAALTADCGLSLTKNGAVRCANERAQRCLNTALRAATLGHLPAPTRVHLHDLTGRLLCVLVVTMMGSEPGIGNVNVGHHAAIFVHQPGTRASPNDILREAYGLTLAETRIAACLARREDVATCAESLHLSTATVRTHLRNLFAKTGTRRQAELISALDFVLRTR